MPRSIKGIFFSFRRARAASFSSDSSQPTPLHIDGISICFGYPVAGRSGSGDARVPGAEPRTTRVVQKENIWVAGVQATLKRRV